MPEPKKIREPININGRKALLIGLGSTGAMACNQILDKMVWRHGSAENIPWVKTVVLETAPLAADLLINKNATCIHLNIDKNDYANLITNPQNYKKMIDFPSWDIPEITGTHKAIENGAANIRIMGRLAFLFNYQTVNNVILGEINKLISLSEQQASTDFSRGSDELFNVTFNTKEPQDGDANETIYVYVVGTLCGGTASGCFIDLGYFLRSRQGYNIESTGLFMLPSQQATNEAHYINAYTALLELNHFSDDRVRYKVQYPDQFYEGMPGMAPFGHTYLVQSRGADPSEYARLVTSTADYIYTDLIGSSGIHRDGKRVNIAQHFVQRDMWGATQQYFTFGLSAIEFPFAKVYKACSLLLAKKGFTLLAGGERLTETQIEQRLSDVPITNKNKSIKQLTQIGDSTIANRIMSKLTELQSKSIGMPEIATIIRDQINVAFDGGQAEAFPDLPARIVPQTVEANSKELRKSTRQVVMDAVRLFLTEANFSGISSLRMFLDALETRIKSLSEELDDAALAAVILDLNNQANFVCEQLYIYHNDPWLKRVGQSRRAKQRCVEELTQILSDYYEQRLLQSGSGALRSLYKDILVLIAKIRKRLEDPSSGMIPEVSSIIRGMDNLYIRTDVSSGSAQDGWTRSINGTELFQPGETIKREYEACLVAEKGRSDFSGSPAEYERSLAVKYVQSYVEKALDDLLMDPSQIGFFDVSRDTQEKSEEKLLELANPNRPAFNELKNRSIIQRILSRPDCANILSDVNRKSALFLGLNSVHPRHKDHENKHYGFVFYDDKDGKSDEFVKELENAKVVGGEVRTLGVSEPNQIIILRERGAFSLGIVQMLIDEQPSNWRSAYENAQLDKSSHSRGDIEEWITWSRVNEEERTGIKNIFLVATALGIVEFHGAMDYRFNYKPMSPADSGSVQFNNDLDDVVLLMRKRTVYGLILQEVNKFRELNGPISMMDKLISFIKEYGDRFVEGDVYLSSQIIQDKLLDYINDDGVLLVEYKRRYPDLSEMLKRKEDGDLEPAYYCPHCNLKLGYTAASLYVTENVGGKSRRVKKCAYCSKSLER